MKRFWTFLTLYFLCANSLGAVLYTGVPAFDDGGGFISLSPFVDAVFWGILIVLFGLAAAYCWWRYRPSVPKIPGAFAFPVSYLFCLALLSVLVLLLGMAQLLDRYDGPFHLPFWGYVAVLAVLYPVLGFLSARRTGGAWWGVLWGIAIGVIFLIMGSELIFRVNARDILPVMEGLLEGESINLERGYTGRLMDCALGGVLGRLNLPACVLMDNYEYAYYPNLGGVHSIPRDVMTVLVCVCPPVLYSVGWLAGCGFRKR